MIISIIGTRPQFLKLAPLAVEFKNNNIIHKTIHTGQHYDKEMSNDLFETLNMDSPNYLLTKTGETCVQNLSNMMVEIEKILLIEKPNKIIVFGDCDTTVAGALVANKLKIQLIHIEAGMRSFNKNMPEEINRLITDNLSNLLLCSTQDSIENLKKENITKNVYYVGNLQLDLLKECCEKYNNESILEKHNLYKNDFVLLTIHREYNTNKQFLNKILDQLSKLDDKILFLAHPRTINVIKNELINIPDNIILLKPINYLEITILERNCKYIITDSGGIQPEAWFLRKKCIILRTETEWTEQLCNNNNILYDYKTPLNEFIKTFLNIKINKINIVNNAAWNIVNIIKYDLNKIYVPIGFGCKSGLLLKKLNLRTMSLPFDYLNCSTYIAKNIDEQFKELLDTSYHIYNENSELWGHKLYGPTTFLHYPNLKEYTKRVNRFKFILDNSEQLIFVCVFLYDDAHEKNILNFLNIKQAVLKYNRTAIFKCLIINNNHKTNIDEINIDESNDDLCIINVHEKINGAGHIPNELYVKSKELLNNI
jgi:UDP-GlcNAc3NAcA epimerase